MRTKRAEVSTLHLSAALPRRMPSGLSASGLTCVKARGPRIGHSGGESNPPMSTATLPAISPQSTLGDLVAAHPALARVFEELSLDYCCGGRQTLVDAASSRSLPVTTLVQLLQGVVAALAAAPVAFDAAGASLSQLADHIERTHHGYLKEELPRLVEISEHVARKHGHRDPRLPQVADTVLGLAREMFDHMEKEEGILFPLVRRIEAGEGTMDLSGPIRQMEAEHDTAGQALARLRELTNGFTPDDQCCNTHRVLLAGLAQLEDDLHRHVHKENNILFPRALALAQV